jgi:clorobiocin biosynthesis protein CloN5
MAEPTLADRLVTFIQGLVTDDQGIEINEQTPLLEAGVLDSLKTAMLLNFIHGELHGTVPIEKMSTQNFKDVRSIAAVIELEQPTSTGTRAGEL